MKVLPLGTVISMLQDTDKTSIGGGSRGRQPPSYVKKNETGEK